MNEIVFRKELNTTVTLLEIFNPLVAKKAQAGQFVILRVDEASERIPLTIASFDRKKQTVTIIFQIVGATTLRLNNLRVNDKIHDFVGPLGKPTNTEGIKRAIVIGGGVGCAIAYPIAKKLFDEGKETLSIIGFRNKDLVILEEEFKNVSNNLTVLTDDGSYNKKGLVTDALKELLDSDSKFDMIFVIGPLIMMKYVCLLAKKYNVRTMVSMNSIMIDGTGMCGCCRLTVGGKTKFACIDGPDFDGFEVDFDEAITRSKIYSDFEKHAYEETCNLFKKEVK